MGVMEFGCDELYEQMVWWSRLILSGSRERHDYTALVSEVGDCLQVANLRES